MGSGGETWREEKTYLKCDYQCHNKYVYRAEIVVWQLQYLYVGPGRQSHFPSTIYPTRPGRVSSMPIWEGGGGRERLPPTKLSDFIHPKPPTPWRLLLVQSPTTSPSPRWNPPGNPTIVPSSGHHLNIQATVSPIWGGERFWATGFLVFSSLQGN